MRRPAVTPLPVEDQAPPALSATTRASVQEVLAPGPGRGEQADQLLADLARTWHLQTYPSQRWLLAAQEVLRGPEPLDLFVQYDAVLRTVSVELWDSGRCVFGIDDWVG